MRTTLINKKAVRTAVLASAELNGLGTERIKGTFYTELNMKLYRIIDRAVQRNGSRKTITAIELKA